MNLSSYVVIFLTYRVGVYLIFVRNLPNPFKKQSAIQYCQSWLQSTYFTFSSFTLMQKNKMKKKKAIIKWTTIL